MRFLKIPKPLTLALIAAMFASFPLKMWREYGENAKRRKIGRLQARLAKLENDLAVSATRCKRLFCASMLLKTNLRNFQNESHHPHFKS